MLLTRFNFKLYFNPNHCVVLNLMLVDSMPVYTYIYATMVY